MPRRKKVQLPAAGDAFAVPLDDGRYFVCRVILDADSEPAKQWKSACVLVACSAWIGTEIPSADEPALRPILRLTHHSWPGNREVLWVSDSVPDEFILIGQIQPTSEERGIRSGSFGDWSSLAIQPLAQWRWDHERDAVLAEDQAKDAADSRRRKEARQQRRQYLLQVSLDDLSDHQFFDRWKDYPPAKAVRASRKIMKDTVRDLLGLGPSANEDERMAVLQCSIESFNAIDAKLDFIETVEREDICEEFEAVVHACGLGHYQDLADRWRDW